MTGCGGNDGVRRGAAGAIAWILVFTGMAGGREWRGVAGMTERGGSYECGENDGVRRESASS